MLCVFHSSICFCILKLRQYLFEMTDCVVGVDNITFLVCVEFTLESTCCNKSKHTFEENDDRWWRSERAIVIRSLPQFERNKKTHVNTMLIVWVNMDRCFCLAWKRWCRGILTVEQTKAHFCRFGFCIKKKPKAILSTHVASETVLKLLFEWIIDKTKNIPSTFTRIFWFRKWELTSNRMIHCIFDPFHINTKIYESNLRKTVKSQT